MKGDHQLTESEKQKFLDKLNEILLSAKSVASISGPFQLQSAVRTYMGSEEKWTEYIYDIEITGDLGDFKTFCSFESDREIDEQLSNAVKNAAYEFWAEKDKDSSSLLSNEIWRNGK